jgi:phage tail sheath protein FI
MQDPSEVSPELIEVPPSGSVAGIYARIDAKRGVWKAAAGRESTIYGATGLLVNISDHEQNTLNSIGVNVIRAFQDCGIVIWGSRTLATQSDLEYRYVSVCRTAIYITQSIKKGIQWAVFEPNGEPLWAKIRLNVNVFMQNLFRQGAFQGTAPRDAYFVKCDRETNTQSDINLGIVNIVIGFAHSKPAEFLIIKLSQKVGQ